MKYEELFQWNSERFYKEYVSGKESGLLINADCLKVIENLDDTSIKLLLTDPPYGIDFQSHRKKDKSKHKPKILNDKSPFIDFISPVLPKITNDGGGYIFTRWDVQQKFIDEMLKNNVKPKNVIIWNKGVHGMGDLKRAYGSKYESIIWYANKGFRFPNKRPSDILTHQRVTPNKLVHPNEKPISLMEELILNSTNEGDIVFDPFAGSCSTLVACKRTNRKFLGVELDKNHFEIGCRRLKKVSSCGNERTV